MYLRGQMDRWHLVKYSNSWFGRLLVVSIFTLSAEEIRSRGPLPVEGRVDDRSLEQNQSVALAKVKEVAEELSRVPQAKRDAGFAHAALENLKAAENLPAIEGKPLLVSRSVRLLYRSRDPAVYRHIRERVLKMSPFDPSTLTGWEKLGNGDNDVFRQYAVVLAVSASDDQLKDYLDLMESADLLVRRNLIWAVGFTGRPELVLEATNRVVSETHPVLRADYCRSLSRSLNFSGYEPIDPKQRDSIDEALSKVEGEVKDEFVRREVRDARKVYRGTR